MRPAVPSASPSTATAHEPDVTARDRDTGAQERIGSTRSRFLARNRRLTADRGGQPAQPSNPVFPSPMRNAAGFAGYRQSPGRAFPAAAPTPLTSPSSRSVTDRRGFQNPSDRPTDQASPSRVEMVLAVFLILVACAAGWVFVAFTEHGKSLLQFVKPKKSRPRSASTRSSAEPDPGVTAPGRSSQDQGQISARSPQDHRLPFREGDKVKKATWWCGWTRDYVAAWNHARRR